MEKVDIETCITLSRVAAANDEDNNLVTAIPFGRVVERYAAKTAKLYGGEVIDNAQVAFTAGTVATAVSLETAVFDIYEGTTPKMNRFDSTTLATTGIIAVKNVGTAIDMSNDTYVYILIKSDTTTAAGGIKFAIAEDADIGTPRDVDLPIMVADAWYFFKLPFTGTTAQRDAVISYGFRNETGAAWSGVLDVQYIGRGNALYEPLGICTDDQIAIHDNTPTEEYQEYDDMTVLAAGHINAKLAKGITCVQGQKLYPLPGNGKLTTTAFTATNESRVITATEDQTVAGSQVGVRL